MQGRVLVVDDEKAMRLALTGLLAKEGYQVEAADSGEAAVRVIEAGRFHVVITDLEVEDLFPSAAPKPMAPAAGGDPAAPFSFREAKAAAVESFERAFLVAALRRHDGNISKAAEEIGMYRQNLQQKMRELGITPEEI